MSSGPVEFPRDRARELGLAGRLAIAAGYDVASCPALRPDDKPCGSQLFEPVQVVSLYLPRGKRGGLEHAHALQYRCKDCGAMLPGESLVKQGGIDGS